MFTPGRCGPRRPKPESKTEIVEHPYKTLYTPASNLAQRRAKRASSVLLIRLYGRRTAGSTPIKGANVDKRAGTRAMARSTIGSPFLPVEAQETSMNLFPDRTPHESNASDRSLPVAIQRLRGIDATTDLFAFVAAIRICSGRRGRAKLDPSLPAARLRLVGFPAATLTP
jgi:hypothetical protein